MSCTFFVRRTLLCGLLLAWATTSECSSAIDPLKTLVPPENCTVFTHLVKSGGTTVKDHLIEASILYDVQMPGDSCSTVSLLLEGAKGSCVRELHNSSVITSPFGELLRFALKNIGRQCDYFTMMRHPIDRLVSAFFYCPTDYDVERRASKVCTGHHELNATKTFLMEFATTRWGNKAMDQIILSTLCPRNFGSIFCSEKQGIGRHPKDMSSPVGLDLIERAQETLTRYKAVGIFEHFELSMELFNAVVVSPVHHWTAGKHSNTGKRSNLRQELLAWAHLNTELRRFLAPDLMIYDQAVSIFQQQTTAELGTQW